MSNKKPFVQSNYPRVPGDYYPTIDKCCTWALLEHFKPQGLVVDPCAPNGSGIVDTLRACGYEAEGRGDAFSPFEADCLVTNPPYSRAAVITNFPVLGEGEPVVLRPLVDEIIYMGIHQVIRGQVRFAAYLLRGYFDYAKSRAPMFDDCPYYFGEIKIRTRPRWKKKEKGDSGPIHQFSWHIWSLEPVKARSWIPVKLWADGLEPESKNPSP